MAKKYSLDVKINGVDTAVSTIGELESALNETNNELKNLEIGSEAFIELSTQARKLNNELGQNFTKLTNFDENLSNITASVGRLGSTISSGFAVATSAMGIFGDESEELAEAALKAQQALTLAYGASQIATNAARIGQDLKNVTDTISLNLTRIKNSLIVTQTTLTNTNTSATNAATVAQRALNAAQSATPILLLVTGVSALVAALVLLNKEEDKSIENADRVNEAYLEQTKTLKRNEDATNNLIKKRVELLILEEQDPKKKAELQAQLYQYVNDQQAKSLKDQEDRLAKSLRNSKSEYEKINKDFLQITQKTDEVVGEYMVKTFDGYETRLVYGKEIIQLGKEEMDAELENYQLKIDLLNKKIEADEEGLYTQEIINFNKQQLEIEYYENLLKIQEEYLEKEGKLNDKGVRERFEVSKKNLSESLILVRENIKEQESFNTETKIKEAKDGERTTQTAKDELDKRTKAWRSAYNDIKKVVSDTFKDIQAIEEEYTNKLIELQAKTEVDRLVLSEKASLDRLNKFRDQRKKEIEESVLNDEEKKKALDDFDIFYKKALDSQLEYYGYKIEKEINLEKDRAEQLKLISKILDEEIAFGDQSTLDRLETIAQRQQELEISKIDFEMANNRLSIKEFERLQEDRLTLLKESLKTQRDTELAESEATVNRDLENFRKSLIQEFGIDADISEQMNKYKLNLERQLVVRKEEINEQYRQDDLNAEKKKADDEFEYKVSKLNEYNSLANSFIEAGLSLANSIMELQKVESENELMRIRDQKEEELNIYKNAYNEQAAALQEKLQNGIIDQTNYNNTIAELNQKLTDNTNKTNEKARLAELKQKEKAFEADKKMKIAQAVISGAQGAVSAFAGAMQLGPIAGPIVGAILAAAVGVTTGIQVAAIKKTKFDSGGGGSISTVTPPSAVGGVESLGNASGGGFTGFNEDLVNNGSNNNSNDQGNTGTSTNNDPIYVSVTEINKVQKKVSVLESQSSFG